MIRLVYGLYNDKKELVNTIVGTEAFVHAYSSEMGYTYHTLEQEPVDSPPTEMEQIRADIDFLAAIGGVEL